MPFLDLRKNHGAEEERARDLFYALWIPDIFMERVEEDGDWQFYCPNEAKELFDTYGDKFREEYLRLEKIPGRAKLVMKARAVWAKIMESQMETGGPFMLYKDACNNKTNQKNLGTIHCSNLCTEVVQYTDKHSVAVCNLSSVALPMYVDKSLKFNHNKLHEVVKHITLCLNRIIDVNYYPVKEAEYSNRKNRPIGIGIQGLADVFLLMDLAFDEPAARQLNEDIHETMYHAAMEASCELAMKDGPYDSYEGSPVSQGIYQFDMWNAKPKSGRWDWDALKAKTKKYGVRNSLLLAPMPTASTSQILGNNEW